MIEFIILSIISVFIILFLLYNNKNHNNKRKFNYKLDYPILNKNGMWKLFSSIPFLHNCTVYMTSKPYIPPNKDENNKLLKHILSNKYLRKQIINKWIKFIRLLINHIHKNFEYEYNNKIIEVFVTGGSNFCLLITYEFNFISNDIKQLLIEYWNGWSDLDLKIKINFRKIKSFEIFEKKLIHSIYHFMYNFRSEFNNCFPDIVFIPNENKIYKRSKASDFTMILSNDDNNNMYRYIKYKRNKNITILSSSFNILIPKKNNNICNFNLFRYKIPYINLLTNKLILIENIDIGIPRPNDIESKSFLSYRHIHFTYISSIHPSFKSLSIYGLQLSIENMLRIGCTKKKKRQERLKLLKQIVFLYLK